MPNTVTQKTLHGSANSTLVSRIIHIQSDGSEESDLVIFDNDAFSADTSKGRLLKVCATGSSCTCILEWDQATDSEIIRFNPLEDFELDFMKLGGGANPAGTGATGDLTLTTADLDNGDSVTITIVVQQA